MAARPSERDLSSVLADFVQQSVEGGRRRPAPSAAAPAAAQDEEMADIDRELLELEAQFERETGISLDELADEEGQRLRDEIEARFQGGFVGGGAEDRSDEELLAELPEAQRQKLLSLPAEERTFLLRADPVVRSAYEKLPPPQREVLVRLPADQRTAFLTMPTAEKSFVQSLQPEVRQYFLRLNPDSRDQFRAATPDQRTARFEEAKKARASLAKKTPEEAARLLAVRIFDDLGIVSAWHPELLQRAAAIAFNHLRSHAGDEAGAELTTLKVLLEEPDVVEPLLEELEVMFEGSGEEGEEVSMTGAEGMNPMLLAEHFVRIRPQLYALITRLAQPGLTRNVLSEALRKCTIVSASVALSMKKA